MDGAHIIEVNDLVISVETKRSEKKAKFPLLQKMRRMLCDADNDVYKPSVVSIGPYHHKAEATLDTEQQKWECFGYIIRLFPEKTMRDYLEAIAGLEQQIRSCYGSEIKINDEEFLKMVLLDGCFILYILYGTQGGVEPTSNINISNTDERNLKLAQGIHDPVTSIEVDGSRQNNGNCTSYNDKDVDNIYYSKHWYTTFLTHDLLLLENQVPFFVVVKLFEVATNGSIPITVLLENVARFIKDLLLSYPKANFEFDQPKEFHHLLYLCHWYFKPNIIEVNSNSDLRAYDDDGVQSGKLLGWHRAMEYGKAGG